MQHSRVPRKKIFRPLSRKLVPFVENLLEWIEHNLGLGLLNNSLKQLYAADVEFELEPDDFLLRLLQGVQINNLGPLFKITYLRVKSFLDPELADMIITSVTKFEQQIQTDRLVEIFPWQKKRSVMREIRAELELPEGAVLLNGQAKEKLGHLEGRSNKIGQTFLLATPTDNRVRKEWTIQAPAGTELELHIHSERAGKLHKTIRLK